MSRDEWDADGEASVQNVEEVFVASSRVYHLTVGQRTIRTTAAHPFSVEGKGWTGAAELRDGDVLVEHDFQRVAVQAVWDTGEEATVYNLRISNHHTYFVEGLPKPP